MKTSKLSTDISHFRDAHNFSYCPKPHNSYFGKIFELVKDMLSLAELVYDFDTKFKVDISNNKYDLDNLNVNVKDIDMKLKKKKDIEELDIVENFSLLLDTELSESLLMERLSRELVSYIQKERKNQGLDVTDRIKLTISSEDEFVHETITNFSKYITNETLTLDLITKKESSVNKVYDRFLDIFIERSTNNS